MLLRQGTQRDSMLEELRLQLRQRRNVLGAWRRGERCKDTRDNLPWFIRFIVGNC